MHVKVSRFAIAISIREKKHLKCVCRNSYFSPELTWLHCIIGDSGGPLYDKEGDVLVGVVSWGYGEYI